MGPQLSTLKEGPYYWNQSVHPEVDAYTLFKNDLFKEKGEYLKQGFRDDFNSSKGWNIARNFGIKNYWFGRNSRANH